MLMKIIGLQWDSTNEGEKWGCKDMNVANVVVYTNFPTCYFFQADYEQQYIIFNPTSCSNPENCQGANIRPVKTAGSFNYKDYQEIKIQVQYVYFSFKISNCPWSLILNAVHSM